MRNMKISGKLMTGFVLVTALAVLVGIFGIIGMRQINNASEKLYNHNYLPSMAADRISQIIVEQRVHIRNIVIYNRNEDIVICDEALDALEATHTEMEELMTYYKDTITRDDDRETFNEFVALYENEWAVYKDTIVELGTLNNTAGSRKALREGVPISARLDELTNALQRINTEDGAGAVESNTQLYGFMTIVEGVILLGVVIVSVLLALYISGLIAKPMHRMKALMEQVGDTGSLEIPPEMKAALERDAANRDEVGESITAFKKLISHITATSHVLQTIAGGDLRSEIETLSSRDELGIALQKMQENLNHMFGEINISTKQVSSGSRQIADGAQSLAQGSTEQAASIEQLSSSITQIANKTHENAQMAIHAAELSGAIRSNAQTGSTQMNQMMDAVREINEASQSISKVIKVIDDIAFQTNILALNAAVEAARAGQHGKGFAVVAEEVRNLAAKSAAAAQDTGSMIQNSIEKASLGARIADETFKSLQEIVAGINESTEIVNDIARSSEEQSEAIKHINTGIDQVAQVVQQNSATAEQSASSSEEMNGQSEILQGLVAQFKLKGQPDTHLTAPAAARKTLAMPPKGTGTDAGFGKY